MSDAREVSHFVSSTWQALTQGTYKRVSECYIYEIQNAFRTVSNSEPFVFKSYILFDGSKARGGFICFCSLHLTALAL